MRVEVKDGIMTIRLAMLPEPRPSRNSKGTFVVATSGGFKPVAHIINGYPVVVGANAFYQVDESIPAEGDGADGAEKPADDAAKNTEATGAKTKKK